MFDSYRDLFLTSFGFNGCVLSLVCYPVGYLAMGLNKSSETYHQLEVVFTVPHFSPIFEKLYLKAEHSPTAFDQSKAYSTFYHI